MRAKARRGARNAQPCGILSTMLVVVSAPLAGQGPDVPLPPVALDSVLGFSAGVDVTTSLGRGEAFHELPTGYGMDGFLGIGFGVVDEVRLGVLWSRHGDPATGGVADLRGVFAEVHWAAGSGGARFRIAPRLAWLDLDAGEPGDLAGFGVGGTAGPQLRLTERWVLDTGVSVTFVTFPRPAGSPDPDGVAYGTVWAVRLGAAYAIRR